MSSPPKVSKDRYGRAGAMALCWAALLLSAVLPAVAAQEVEPAPAETAEGVPPVEAPAGPTDDALRRAIEARLGAIEQITELDVDVEAGVVTLEGTGASSDWIDAAEQVASSFDGVVEVRNELIVSAALDTRLEPVIERLSERAVRLVALLPLFVLSLIILAVGHFVARWVSRRDRLFARLSANPFLRGLLAQAVYLGILLLAAILALEVLDATSFVAALLGTAGIAGLALGFAFRDLAENYIASILLSLRQPFAPGDHVVIDGSEGRVTRLTSRATVLVTLEGNHLRIPNAAVFKSNILNYTRNPTRRFEVAVGIATEAELHEATAAGTRALRGMASVLDEPEPFALIEELGDSNVTVRFHGWVDQREYDFNRVRGEAMRQIKRSLEADDIEMPEPIYRLRIEGAVPVASGSDTEERGAAKTLSVPATRASLSEEAPSEDDLRSRDELEKPIREELESGDENLLSGDSVGE